MAKYKKKRVRELKHDRFRDTTMLLADRLADRVAGRGKLVLLGLLGLVIVGGAVYGVVRWRQKHAEEAEQAMGRAIAINVAGINTAPVAGSDVPAFSTQQERSERAIQEFEKIVAKYGDPYRSQAQYFIATNRLVTDRVKGESELLTLSQGKGDIAVLAKFALAQAKEADGNLDEAARLFNEIAAANSDIVTPDTAKVRVAIVYDKQGKKKEAADLLFNLVDAGRKLRDKEGKPVPESAAAREAAQKLLKIDPARHAQLTPIPPPTGLSF